MHVRSKLITGNLIMNDKNLMFRLMILAVVAIALSACGGQGSTVEQNDVADDTFSIELDRENSIAADDVKLELVRKDSLDGKMEFDVVASNMQDTKAIYGKLKYPRDRFRYKQGHLNDAMDKDLFLARKLGKGLEFGFVVANFDRRAGTGWQDDHCHIQLRAWR